MTLRVLALTRYGRLGSASRLRVLQYVPALAQANMQVHVQPLLSDESLERRYVMGRYGMGNMLLSYGQRLKALMERQQFDLIWIEKEALPWFPLWIEQRLLTHTPYVLDFDDAVFHNYDRHRLGLVRRLYGHRIDGLMARASLVVCGNDYLAQRARQAGATWVEQLPTVIDVQRYPLQMRNDNAVPKVVWIGSPSTAKYLDLLKRPLQQLARQQRFVLRVVGAQYAIEGVDVENLAWTEDSEVQAIADCDVGVMPLLDSPWELGKCGYKLIQYMACGLPVVASPVGVNETIVSHGVDGLLASQAEDWSTHLGRLLADPALSTRMGQAGRHKVEQAYCLQVTSSRLVAWFEDIKPKQRAGEEGQSSG